MLVSVPALPFPEISFAPQNSKLGLKGGRVFRGVDLLVSFFKSMKRVRSITIQVLHGSFYFDTGEWTDGLVAIFVRVAVSDTTVVLYWGGVRWVRWCRLDGVREHGPGDYSWCASPRGSGSLPPMMTITSRCRISRCVTCSCVDMVWIPRAGAPRMETLDHR